MSPKRLAELICRGAFVYHKPDAMLSDVINCVAEGKEYLRKEGDDEIQYAAKDMDPERRFMYELMVSLSVECLKQAKEAGDRLVDMEEREEQVKEDVKEAKALGFDVADF